MKRLLCLQLLAALAMIAQAEAPYIDPGDDREHLGEADRIFFWTTAQKVAGFRNQNLLYPMRPVTRGKQVFPLSRDLQDLGNTAFTYQDKRLTIDDYFRDYNTAGLIVIKDGVIRYERYGLGNTEHTRWLSWSVTKSITSLLLGAAIHDGFIESVDEKVTDYLPQLKGSAYEDVTIRHLLQMSSGVDWDETYSDPLADINRVEWQTPNLYTYLGQKKRAASPGTKFNYSTADINLVGNVVMAATGVNLSDYLSARIWQAYGMEDDAYWQLVAEDDVEYGGSSLSATLRDFGRIGLFALGDGILADGRRALPENWMTQSTTPSPLQAGYGYLWWLGSNGVYRALGIFGQAISVDPHRNVVIAQHSVREQASSDQDWEIQAAAFHALAEAVSR